MSLSFLVVVPTFPVFLAKWYAGKASSLPLNPNCSSHFSGSHFFFLAPFFGLNYNP